MLATMCLSSRCSLLSRSDVWRLASLSQGQERRVQREDKKRDPSLGPRVPLRKTCLCTCSLHSVNVSDTLVSHLPSHHGASIAAVTTFNLPEGVGALGRFRMLPGA